MEGHFEITQQKDVTKNEIGWNVALYENQVQKV